MENHSHSDLIGHQTPTCCTCFSSNDRPSPALNQVHQPMGNGFSGIAFREVMACCRAVSTTAGPEVLLPIQCCLKGMKACLTHILHNSESRSSDRYSRLRCQVAELLPHCSLDFCAALAFSAGRFGGKLNTSFFFAVVVGGDGVQNLWMNWQDSSIIFFQCSSSALVEHRLQIR